MCQKCFSAVFRAQLGMYLPVSNKDWNRWHRGVFFARLRHLPLQ